MHLNASKKKQLKTRMHSSRIRTARSLIVSPYLVISHAGSPPGTTMHAPPGATTHAPLEQAHTPPGSKHACPPEQPCMPPQSNQACPPGATMHAPQSNHACPPWSNHACPPGEQPCMPPPHGSNHARLPPVCKNITFANFVCGR